MRLDKQHSIKNMLKIRNELNNSKYLGLLSFVGRSENSIFSFIKGRVRKKVHDRSHKNLSKAGKTIMIKNVGQSILAYNMTCFLLTKSLCSELERMLNGY